MYVLIFISPLLVLSLFSLSMLVCFVAIAKLIYRTLAPRTMEVKQNGHGCPICLATLRGCRRETNQGAKQNGHGCPICLSTLHACKRTADQDNMCLQWFSLRTSPDAACSDFKVYWRALLSFPVHCLYRFRKARACPASCRCIAGSTRRGSRGEESEEGGEGNPWEGRPSSSFGGPSCSFYVF